MTKAKTTTKTQDIKAKKPRTSTRIKVNTCLLLLLTVSFGILTWCGASRIMAHGRGYSAFIATDDAPGICFEEESDFINGHPTTRKGPYVCITENDESYERVRTTDANDYTMFLSEHISFTSTIESTQLAIILFTIGLMSTIASLIGAIVYWNHNHGR